MQLKLILSALCALSFATGSLAAPAETGTGKWIFGGEFGYAAAGSSDNVFASNSNSPITFFNTAEVKGPSFGALFGYDDGNGLDVMANWQHSHDDSGNRHVVANAGNPIKSTRGLNDFANTSANGEQKAELDWVQLTFGHSFHTANQSIIHVGAGVDGVWFEHNLWTNTFADNSNNHWANFKSEFDGGGLIAAIDYLKPCWAGVQFFSRALVGLNYGDLDSKVTSQLTQTIGGAQAIAERKVETKNTVIPVVAGEIGLGYGQQFWNLQVGVRAMDHFDMVQQAQTITATTTNASDYREAEVFGRVSVNLSNS